MRECCVADHRLLDLYFLTLTRAQLVRPAKNSPRCAGRLVLLPKWVAKNAAPALVCWDMQDRIALVIMYAMATAILVAAISIAVHPWPEDVASLHSPQ